MAMCVHGEGGPRKGKGGCGLQGLADRLGPGCHVSAKQQGYAGELVRKGKRGARCPAGPRWQAEAQVVVVAASFFPFFFLNHKNKEKSTGG